MSFEENHSANCCTMSNQIFQFRMQRRWEMNISQLYSSYYFVGNSTNVWVLEMNLAGAVIAQIFEKNHLHKPQFTPTI